MSKQDNANAGRAEAGENQASVAQNQSATSNASALPRLAFTMKETAKIIGVSYITVHRLLKRGKLRASDAVRNKVIPLTEIQRFLAESIQGDLI